MISKILVPVDGSEYASKAISYAIFLAQSCGAEITLIHVIPSPTPVSPEIWNTGVMGQMEKRGKGILKEGTRTVKRAGLKVDHILEYGDPGTMVIQAAEKGDFDLVIMGSRGLTRLRSLLMGSVSYKVSHRAKCPVLIVR
ncbi:MAG: universal stress protein [Candidatus Bathyarchaeia archaeon]